MKRRTLRLLAFASALYLGFLLFLRSILPEEVTPSLPLLAAPLILLALILSGDLFFHATVPSNKLAKIQLRRIRARDVQFLTEQVAVGTTASAAYFDSIVLSRLREMLGEKVSMETGLEKSAVKQRLANSLEGIRLLRDQDLYRLLYDKPPVKGKARLKMLIEAIERIEAWKA
ncbi:MAG TPA: hypothetical protein VGS11_03040 [Candidatus Bathyarchaeia archaeon]|nr:hypothetical protein [Candidatus Bathyarchaeia archaeon]